MLRPGRHPAHAQRGRAFLAPRGPAPQQTGSSRRMRTMTTDASGVLNRLRGPMSVAVNGPDLSLHPIVRFARVLDSGSGFTPFSSDSSCRPCLPADRRSAAAEWVGLRLTSAQSTANAWDSDSGGRSPGHGTRAHPPLANRWDPDSKVVGLRLTRGRFAAERVGLRLTAEPNRREGRNEQHIPLLLIILSIARRCRPETNLAVL